MKIKKKYILSVTSNKKKNLYFKIFRRAFDSEKISKLCQLTGYEDAYNYYKWPGVSWGYAYY